MEQRYIISPGRTTKTSVKSGTKYGIATNKKGKETFLIRHDTPEEKRRQRVEAIFGKADARTNPMSPNYRRQALSGGLAKPPSTTAAHQMQIADAQGASPVNRRRGGELPPPLTDTPQSPINPTAPLTGTPPTPKQPNFDTALWPGFT